MDGQNETGLSGLDAIENLERSNFGSGDTFKYYRKCAVRIFDYMLNRSNDTN